MRTRQIGAAMSACSLLAALTACSGASGHGTGHGSPKIAGYGQKAADVAERLHCASSKIFGTAVRCTAVGGQNAAVTTFKNETEQTYTLAIMKDESPTDCAVVLDGVIIGASDELSLTAVVGVPEQFAHDNGGYTLCPVGG